ncbi:unnamed protein product [marine sediment metagenome]|uniref:Uncharacterized protein n=1 Tax=marine sediment metagenome TaxID=412755 RepID=X1HU49_9ZZZZ
MNIKCLFRRHKWEFAYNHGMPFGISTEDALRMFNEGKSYAVYQCTRAGCKKQARLIDEKMEILPVGLVELP